jgi:hypothetical protein
VKLPPYIRPGRAARTWLDYVPAVPLSELLAPPELDHLRAALREIAAQCNTFEGFLTRAVMMLPADARRDPRFVMSVARFAREVWHS